MQNRVSVCLPRNSSHTMLLSAFTSGTRHRLAEEIDTCIRQDCQVKMHSYPGGDSFSLITRYCFILCKELVSPNSYFCIYNKKCSYAIRNCHQANGDNRHLVPGAPTGLGWDIRDMSITCTRTHPDANKHARHIPIYQSSVHSAHASKCSQLQLLS